MPDNFRDYVEPVGRMAAIDRLEHDVGSPPIVPPRQGLRGKVQGIRRGQQHTEGQHRLDITVGGEDTTEIIVRVPQGAYANWEGKKVIIYLEE
jgi:hypothetical protein